MFETPIELGAPRTHGAWKTFWRWLIPRWRDRYTRTLEDEVERLRAENRALLNSLLGTAGFPPILPALRDEARQARVPPVRRRSWHQFAALREWEAAAPTQAPPSPKSPTRQSPRLGGAGDGARYGGGESAPPPAKGPLSLDRYGRRNENVVVVPLL